MLENITFTTTSADVIYDPYQLTTGSTFDIRIANNGTEDITDLGLYVVPATTLGDVDYPAEYPPETDYQDLLTWGEDTDNAVTVSGGLIVTLPQNTGPDVTSYITRSQGSDRTNKLPMADIPASSSITITLEIEAPPSVTRRLYINIALDIGA